ncbi:MAG: DUF1570 domain-containing protein [Candidatus Acidiferrales bacterium]
MATQRAALLISFLVAAALVPLARAGKTENWVEVRSPNFRVISNAGEKQARQTAAQFEKIRAVFRQALPALTAHPSPLVTVFAVKDEKSLQSLLPEYWATKGHMHPAGFFYSNLGEYFVAVRTDITSDDGYEVVYHEYFHSISMPYYPNLPTWVSEGLAEFYGHTHFEGNTVKLGQPDVNHLRLLQEKDLLPLSTLFTVDHSSPYYNEQNRTSVFYAESWAVSHYFMMGEKTDHRAQLTNYLDRLDKGEPQEQAAQEAFGDLRQLQKKIQEYIRLSSYYQVVMKTPAGIDERSFSARMLAPAEVDAARGDWFVCQHKFDEGTPLLKEALRLDPKNVAAQESMGFMNFMRGQHEDATRWFDQAIALDSKNYLVYYYRAMLGRGYSASEATFDEAEKDLRHAIELNPNYALAYSSLAVLVARNDTNLEQALALGGQALHLEPGNAVVQIDYGTVLMLAHRLPEAETVGKRAELLARNPWERRQAEQFLSQLAEYRNMESRVGNSGSYTSEATAARPTIANSNEKSTQPSGPDTDEPSPNNWTGPGRAEGEISSVRCQREKMTLDMNAAGQILHLHSEDFTKTEFLAEDWTPPDHFNPCNDLKGLHARIRFTPSQQSNYNGEIVSIEIRK